MFVAMTHAPTTPGVIRSLGITGALRWLSLAAVAWGAPAVAAAQAPEKLSDKYVVISGKQDPAAIPEYAAWRHAFIMLSLFEPAASARITTDLRLSHAEAAALFAAAREERTRRADCERRQGGALTRAKAEALTPAGTQDLIDAVILGCRQDVLDAAAALLASLHDESKVRVAMFVEQQKASLELTVEKARLPYFRQPR